MIHESAADRKTDRIERRPISPSIAARPSNERESSSATTLKQRVGNQGIRNVMDRARLAQADGDARDPAERQGLQSERFRGDARLESIFDGKAEHFLHSGATGDAVLKVQQALMDLGFPLPKWGADGSFGNETASAVSRYKAQAGISPSDPVVGSRTIAALDAQMLKQPPTPACNDGPVSMEAEPLPPIPLPSITRINGNELLDVVRKRQVSRAHIPENPPLGANIPGFDNLKPVSVRTEPVLPEPCFKCIADWELPQPRFEIFITVGDFSDEPDRSFPVQDQSVSGCPYETGGTFKKVIKRVMPEVEPMILGQELEHWSDFVLTYSLITGRFLSNVRRLTPERTHLRGKDHDDCVGKVERFLLETSTFPWQPAISYYGALSGYLVDHVYSDTTTKRESDHSAVSVPPRGKKPVFPNIDHTVNPFTCKAFYRKFDKTMSTGLPGPPFSSLIEDKEAYIPAKRPWNSL
ncbi:peptidoglycan-binding protein [Lysobacter sp. MMG2]|uniref:peptidoglycan-binding domain-containing protein n=1 Tax=Lysobacter sp. MMG2 TaxID=2801338 RepID=UPI001C215C54|nr:peptidoglycan-binding domain-containing protein [Lysobacter sp. MMG2]MBU8974525.1 peptidoglycan-binding protein [Lysobacter sp. MMG2]